MHCRPVFLLISLFALQIAILPNGSSADSKIKISQSSVLKLFQCLINYDYAQKARSIRDMPRNDLKSNDEVLAADPGGKQMEYYMSAYFDIEPFMKHCVKDDEPLEELIKKVLNGPDGFIENGKKRLVAEFKEIKTTGGWIYENRGVASGNFGTRGNKFEKGLRFWRRMLTPFWLAVKGSILEPSKELGTILQKQGNIQDQLEAFEWELKRIEDEIEADLEITKYTYHNYYVGEHDEFKQREHHEETNDKGWKIKVFHQSIEDHEKENLYFDQAYRAHRQYIDAVMKNVQIVPDAAMTGHSHAHHPSSPIQLSIPGVQRVFWIVRRLSAYKEPKDLTNEQISLIKADLKNAFEQIPISKIFITLVEHKDRKMLEVKEGMSEKEKAEIAKKNKATEAFNEAGPGKVATKNREAEITARHILGSTHPKVQITQIPPMPEKKQYVQGEEFGAGDDSDLPTLIDLLKIVTSIVPVDHFVEKKEEQPVPMETEEGAGESSKDVEAMETDESEQPAAKASYSGKGQTVASLLTPQEIEKIAAHQKSTVPAWKAKDWVAPNEKHLEHIVLVTDLAAVMALQQLVESKYKYAAPGCIVKLVERPENAAGATEGDHTGLEDGLENLRLISGGIYKHLGGLKHKDAAFFTKYFAN